jgi:CheY-like chemotaxis protein
VFANSASIMREKAASRHVQVELEVAPELGSIQADGRKLKQIVYNLLSNAVKFSGEGGRVTLRARPVVRAEVGQMSGDWPGRSLPLTDDNRPEFARFIEISATDTGIGISPEGMERLFRPFSQVDSGLARRFEGTGLGLAMVKLLAELHGGAVAVQSAVGEGSRFTVWLPLRPLGSVVLTPASAAPVIPIAPASPPVDEVRTALVVEDDYRSAELIRVQLEAEGFEVLHAASGEAALVLAQQQPLSLITLDIMLPGMDGWEVLRRLKQLPTVGAVPVVIVSIMADQATSVALGAAAVVQKPVTRQELTDTLVQLGLFPRLPGRLLRILVVDDDPQSLDLMALRVLGLASTVLRARGGREAIGIAQRELPDLIVLDLMMPEVNGFDVVGALLQRPETARIPVLVVTSKSITAEDRAQLDGYVVNIVGKQEFDRDGFVAEVRRALSGPRVVA